jgi:hypothetical protein
MHVNRNILQFWRNIELFRPFGLNEVYNRYASVIEIKASDSMPPPWIDATPYELDADYYYGFDLFLGIFSLDETKVLCDQLLPPSRQHIYQDDRSFEGLSAVLRVAIDPYGEALLGETSISTLPFAFEQFRSTRKCDLRYFDAKSGDLLKSLNFIFHTNCQITLENLIDADIACASHVPFSLRANELICAVVPHRLKQREHGEMDDPLYSGLEKSKKLYDELVSTLPKRRKVEILNSFFLRDLDFAHSAILTDQNAPLAESSALLEYVTSAASVTTEPALRVNIRTQDGFEELLNCNNSLKPLLGSWPTESSFVLSPEQEHALKRLAEGNVLLTAVNGAPGTGKSTIIRDLLAHLVTRRAVVLSELTSPQEALQKSKTEVKIGGKSLFIRPLISRLVGYELILASSNNHAVENVSLELPRKDKLPQHFEDASYLIQTATLYRHVLEQSKSNSQRTSAIVEWWGLPTIPLGRKDNRNRAIKAFFTYAFKENSKERMNRLEQGEKLTLFEMRARAPKHKVSFRSAQKNFRRMMQLQATDETSERDVQAALFLAGLELHEAWLREVPYFENELIALRRLLSVSHLASDESVVHMWQLLFMIVPLISTTLASVERMLPGIRTPQFGYGIIDEAGQATPQSVCGILLRVKKALFIGDQRQLEPIPHLGNDIEIGLADSLSEAIRNNTSSITSSAQTIADSSSTIGTILDAAGSRPLWISLPLLLHRRCADPMFSISNAIAYDGMMNQDQPRLVAAHPQLGESSWYHIEGVVDERQWVPNQGVIVRRLLTKLLANTTEPPSFFVITPFRAVARKLRNIVNETLKLHGYSVEIRKEYQRRVGTIHTFQGRECSVVFFILGCDATTIGAALWAGSKPNLINVAVTRARDYLYVVGDRHFWHNKGYFSDLEKMLPVAKDDNGL